jgi:2-keto-3-deoxy-L-rhamnonate aldolase RhmA
MADMMARLGFDTLIIDLEHMAMTIETAESIVRAVEATGESTTTILRVPDGTTTWVKRALDTGADGVLVPMVESASQAAAIADDAQYPPDGRRGAGGSRATGFGASFDEYLTTANESTAVVVQIETAAGVDEAESIAAVDGIDSLFVGPTDLASSLGGVGSDTTDEFDAAIEGIRAGGLAQDCPVGVYAASPSVASERLAAGFDYVVAGTDLLFARRGAEEYLAALNDGYE